MSGRREVRGSVAGRVRDDVGNSSSSTLTANEQNCAQQLGRFFPQAKAVRIPVQVASLRAGGMRLREATVVEFGEAEYAIFLSTLPLEFDEHVRLESVPEGRTAEGTVVAVQYHEGRKAVAVRFSQGRCDWVTQT
ncbi:MAG TPA: hypothetical protein VIW93_12650 [Candidatus Acidoferrum sp.]